MSREYDEMQVEKWVNLEDGTWNEKKRFAAPIG